MIKNNQLPSFIDWNVQCQHRHYTAWPVGRQTGYHGTSSVVLDDILMYGGLKADYDRCGRGERGVFFGVDYENQFGNIISGFQHALNRARYKVGHEGGKGVIFEVTKDMIQTSRLEQWIALVREDVSIEMLEKAYLLGDLSDIERALLQRLGYRNFENHLFKESVKEEPTKLILATK